jgi:hypothetical protein
LTRSRRLARLITGVLFLLYAYRSLVSRLRANLTSLLVMGLFVAGGTLGLSYYFILKSSLATVPPQNVIVVAKGAATEWESRLSNEVANKIALLDGIVKEGDKPVLSREMASFIFVDQPDVSKFTEPPALRGIDEMAEKVHGIKLITGTMPKPDSLELVVGRRVVERFPFVKVGHVFQLPGGPSTVVGTFSAQGGPFEDELWTPRAALELHQKRRGLNSMTLVTESAERAQQLVTQINESKPLEEAQASTALEFRSSKAGLDGIARAVFILLVLLSVIATFAITTTMNAAVVMRMSELAALAAIGIRRSSLARMIVIESLLLGVAGAALGALISVGAAAAIGRIPLGKVPLDLQVSTTAILVGLALGVAAGLLGSIAPAIQVRRLDILGALR